MTKVALVIIYNHRFDRNIDKLEKIYRGKFSHIYHVIPFYDGSRPNIIAVYENSYFFSGYVAQAYTHLKGLGFSHFLFVADDMILNPIVTEATLWSVTGLSENECCLPANPKDLTRLQSPWHWFSYALTYTPRCSGVEALGMLPSREDAIMRLNSHGFHTPRLTMRCWLKQRLNGDKCSKIPVRRTMIYPTVGCYSDIFLVTADVMPKFAQYCGIFAATRLFVELAIPTALYLAADRIRDNSTIKLHYGALWTDEEKAKLLGFAKCDLNQLLLNFPSDLLFLHPVKLSQWQM